MAFASMQAAGCQLCNAFPPVRRRPRLARIRAAAASAARDRLLLAATREQTDPDAAFDAPGHGFSSDAAAGRFGSDGALDAMRQLAGEMRREGHAVGAGVVRPFVESYARLGQFDGAVDLVLNQLDRLLGVQADTAACNHLLAVLAEAGRMKLLESVFAEMLSRENTRPDVATFNTLIGALCEVRQARTAVLMLEEMPGHGVAPNEATFTTLMRGFVEEGSVEAALRVKAWMPELGCSPTGATVNVLIDGYCKLGRVEDALAYPQQEIADDFEPDHVTFSTLVNGLWRAGHVRHALRVVDLMLQEMLPPTVQS